MTHVIDQTRLSQITALHHGAHSPSDAQMCAMEAVAFVAGEPWSDHPQCASPVIGAFMRAWNDGLPDDERNALLLPLISRLVGTRGSQALEERRSLMAADWLVREHTPAWLELAGLKDQSAMLRALPEITSMAQVPSIRGPLEAVRKGAAAAWDAAGEAARAAARAAAGAAAWAAAGDAAGAAARAAAWDALKPTRDALQQSALRLVERMIEADDTPNKQREA